MINALVKAYIWQKELDDGKYSSIKELPRSLNLQKLKKSFPMLWEEQIKHFAFDA